jgi:dGTP triphosphohydrolase
LLFARDRIAGDDEYLFTTPCNVFSQHHDRARDNPAVAFRLSYVADVAEQVAFRVHDLKDMYKGAEGLVSDPPQDDLDEDEWEQMTDEERNELHEEQIASAVAEQIQAIADCGTQYETGVAVELVQLYAQLVGGFRTDATWVPNDDPERLRIYQRAQELFPEALTDADDWAYELMIEGQVRQLREDWKYLFGDPEEMLPSFPTRLLGEPSGKRPELLVGGSLSLCEASFYRDTQGAWRQVPEEVCLSGRKSWR